MAETAFLRFLAKIRFRTGIIVFIVLAILSFSLTYVGIKRSQTNLLNSIRQQGTALIETLIQSSQNTVKSNALVELLIDDRLSDVATMVRHLAQAGNLTGGLLAKIAYDHGLERIDLLDRRRNIVLSNSDDFKPDYLNYSSFSIYLDSVIRGAAGTNVIAIEAADPAGAERLAIVTPGPTQKTAIAILASLDFLGDFRREIGIGYLIQRISQETGIEYIVVQSVDGIVLASPKVKQMSRIDSDLFLAAAMQADTVSTRLTHFENRPVLEVVKPFHLLNFPVSLYRVGLSLEGYRRIAASFRRQMLIISGTIFILGWLVIGLVVVNKNYGLLQSAYQETKGLANTVLDAMEGAVIAVDHRGVLTVFNPKAEAMIGRGAPEVLNKKCLAVFPDDRWGLQQVIAGGRTQRGTEQVLTDPEGQARSIVFGNSRILNRSGQMIGAVAVIHDLTEIKRLEEAARRSERLSALGNLAAGVAHEIRNPLNAISIAAQRLRVEFAPPKQKDEYRRLTEAILSEVQRLNETVTQFLSLARAQTLHKEPTDLNRVLQEIVDLIKMETGDQKIKIKTELRAVGTVDLDPGEIKKAVLNICLNGLQAMQTDPDQAKEKTLEIKNRLSADKRWVEIQVTDTGRGIPPENRSRLFQPYFTTKEGGTGLGLAIAHRIVTDHKGIIEVTSNIGKGSTFVIMIPRNIS